MGANQPIPHLRIEEDDAEYLERNASLRGELNDQTDQIQMYATNAQGSRKIRYVVAVEWVLILISMDWLQLNNPLVSPIYQTSLGGLCPLMFVSKFNSKTARAFKLMRLTPLVFLQIASDHVELM